ncbi:MAG: acyl transferase, partial [Daejeonella sp.]
HAVLDISVYIKSFRKAFEMFYGDLKKYAILALLPSYLEREGSSLIYMADDLIRLSGNEKSGYFLYDHAALNKVLKQLKREKTPALLIGVTYALLDFAESRSI